MHIHIVGQNMQLYDDHMVLHTVYALWNWVKLQSSELGLNCLRNLVPEPELEWNCLSLILNRIAKTELTPDLNGPYHEVLKCHTKQLDHIDISWTKLLRDLTVCSLEWNFPCTLYLFLNVSVVPSASISSSDNTSSILLTLCSSSLRITFLKVIIKAISETDGERSITGGGNALLGRASLFCPFALACLQALWVMNRILWCNHHIHIYIFMK